MPSVLGVVVTFHPNSELVENIDALALQVDSIVVVSNETTAEARSIFFRITSSKVSFIYNQENRGVAEGFNQGMRYGIEKGFDYVLLMDQDSQVTPGMVQRLLDVAVSSLERGKLVIVGAIPRDRQKENSPETIHAVEEAPLLISSGSLIPKKVIDTIGFYDELMFIDHVDHDYSIRLIKSGGQCLRVNSAILFHRFGKAEIKNYFGFKFFVQDYSAFRRYFMMRNRIILYKRYGMFASKWFWLDLRSAVKDLVKLVFFESGKMSKLKAVSRGLRDGILWQERRH